MSAGAGEGAGAAMAAGASAGAAAGADASAGPSAATGIGASAGAAASADLGADAATRVSAATGAAMVAATVADTGAGPGAVTSAAAAADAQAYYRRFAHDPARQVGLEGCVPAAGVGYAPAEALRAPAGSDRGLSSGNPFAGLTLALGARVLDIGCGAGRDCFLASLRVGPAGQVLGIDATEDMVQLARGIAQREGFGNVSFVCADACAIPTAEGSFDYVLSNCVFNNIANKDAAFAEVRRVLRPGGTFSFSDVMITPEASPRLAKSKTACLARAVSVSTYVDALQHAGFAQVELRSLKSWPTYRGVVSAHVVAV